MKIVCSMLVPAFASLSLAFVTPARAEEATTVDLAQQIFDTMIQVHGVQPGFRPVHAKGGVCHGTFEPTKEAATLSKSAHFQSAVPITVRFSDGSTDPMIPDPAPNAGPRGMAIRFHLPNDEESDIVAMSHNGFVVANGQEFLELQKAIVATDPSKPHPWPIEAFLSTRPLAMKFVTENAIIPESFATEGFFSNNSFVFVNKEDAKQVGRYKIVPVGGAHHLSADEAKTKSPGFLFDDLKARLAKSPVEYKLVVQLPNDGDPTADPSAVWPDDRKTIELGTLRITSFDPDSENAQKKLAFDPVNLTDGIELSDDKLPELRSQVYALSVARRQAAKK